MNKITKGRAFNPPGAYRMGIFWKIYFINPPEKLGQVVWILIYR